MLCSSSKMFKTVTCNILQSVLPAHPSSYGIRFQFVCPKLNLYMSWLSPQTLLTPACRASKVHVIHQKHSEGMHSTKRMLCAAWQKKFWLIYHCKLANSINLYPKSKRAGISTNLYLYWFASVYKLISKETVIYSLYYKCWWKAYNLYHRWRGANRTQVAANLKSWYVLLRGL